jgi:WD40 repeat protein/tetratricopeptide (TPR) repeat protein
VSYWDHVDGKYLNPGLALYEVASGQRLDTPAAPAQQLAYSPRGLWLVFVDGQHLRFRNPQTGQLLGEPLRFTSNPKHPRVSADSASVLVGLPTQAEFWDPQTRQRQGMRLPGRHAALDGEQRFHVSLLGDPVYLRELARVRSRLLPYGERRRPPAVAFNEDAGQTFSPDRRIAVTWQGNTLRLWDTTTGAPIGRPLPHCYPRIRTAAFSPDGKRLATACQRNDTVDAAIRIWDTSTGAAVTDWLVQRNWVATMAFSPDGRTLASGDYNGQVILWDAATGQPRPRRLLHPEIILRLAFSPDGSKLGVGTTDDRTGKPHARLWDVETGKPIGEPMPHRGWVRALGFSPDGRTFFTKSPPTLRLWDARTAAPLSDPVSIGEALAQPRFLPDGTALVTGDDNGMIRLIRTRTGQPIPGAVMPGPGRCIFDVSRDGKLLVAGYLDGTTRLWDLATFQPLGPPIVQRNNLQAVGFTPDGRWFVTTTGTGVVRRWPVPQPPVGDNLEELTLWLNVHTGKEMSAGKTVTTLAPDAWKRHRDRLVARLGVSIDKLPPLSPRLSAAECYDAIARNAAEDDHSFTELWHLDRLVAARPTDWLPLARRAAARVRAGQLEPASVDYARVKELASAQKLFDWYAHQVADSQGRKKPAAGLWYLDRMVACRPKDGRLFHERATVQGQLNNAAEHLADLKRAVELGGGRAVALELVEEHAKARQWAEVARLYGPLVERGPINLTIAHRLALARLASADRDGYCKLCQRLLATTEGRPLPANVWNAILWTCSLGPARQKDSAVFARAVAALGGQLPQAPSERYAILGTLGAALYRLGRAEKAIARLKEGIMVRGKDGQVEDWLLLALCYQQLGCTAVAREWLARAEATADRPGASAWQELEVKVLRDEARALLGKAANR